MALNWGKGAEAVSEGLIRQADIGGLMYKQAAAVESSRKAGELQQQERLWDVGVTLAAQTDVRCIYLSFSPLPFTFLFSAILKAS